ncbi:hypothetical protein AGMMS49965_05530 [Bacteroidia bacterium]|nr:hypothetical protein AGMMS49965_05530 [Bacteroidia bacterium]
MNRMIQKSLSTVIILLISTMAFSQTIEVERFASDEMDLEARVKNPRKDQNGKVCAILKLRTPLLLSSGFTFDAGMIAVVATEQKTNEIWIYLSPGARRITINHKNYGSIRDYEFGEQLKAAAVYIMQLKDIKIVAPPSGPAPVSSHELGNQYFNRRDYNKAKEAYLKSAGQGGPEAAKSQNRLGYMYEKGLGVLQNWAEAEKWYYKSATQGNAEAQYNLGLLYEFGGGGVKKSKREAKKWYKKAAEQGLFEARRRVEMI